MKLLLEIDLPAGTDYLDTNALGVISRVLLSASDVFDVAYDEQEIRDGVVTEVDMYELPWRWKICE
jgi:hypothetical protein